MKLNPRQVVSILAHISFWVALVFVLNSKLLNIVWGPFASSADTLLAPLAVGFSFNAIILYINALWLIPRHLHKKQFNKFWSYSILLIIGCSLIEAGFDTYYLKLHGSIYVDTTGQTWSLPDMALFILMSSFFNLFYWAMAFLYRLPMDWLRNERQKQKLKQAKLSAELDFLKAQMNPHFLFNGINSIYHLIGTDDQKAKLILLRFSDLLRYQLYECNDDFIPLKKEINYLKNYISIEKLRKEEDAVILVDLPSIELLENIESIKIAPLLFSPFLENAFKYLSLHSEKDKNQLEIHLDIVNKILSFSVSNTFTANGSKVEKKKMNSGIGLENVKQRLKLLYPTQHQLDFTNINGNFKVTLKLML